MKSGFYCGTIVDLHVLQGYSVYCLKKGYSNFVTFSFSHLILASVVVLSGSVVTEWSMPSGPNVAFRWSLDSEKGADDADEGRREMSSNGNTWIKRQRVAIKDEFE